MRLAPQFLTMNSLLLNKKIYKKFWISRCWTAQPLSLIFLRNAHNPATQGHRLNWHNINTCFPDWRECGLTLSANVEALGCVAPGKPKLKLTVVLFATGFPS